MSVICAALLEMKQYRICTYCTDCRSVTWAPGFSVLGSKFVLWTEGTLGLGLVRKAPQPVQSLLRTVLPLSSMPLAQLLTEDSHGPVQLWQKLIPCGLLTQAPAAPGTADF